MRSLEAVIAELQNRSDCVFHPPIALPKVPTPLFMPADLTAFYSHFGKADIFFGKFDARYTILPPHEFVQVSEAICGEKALDGVESSWYALIDVQDGNYFAIDLHPERLGWCYDCFHETYGEVGYCKIIAKSFTEQMNLIAQAGDNAFWLDENFAGYGDANDAP